MLDVPTRKTTDRSPHAEGHRRLTIDVKDFSILLVCRANICRSPMAEYLMRQQVQARHLPVRVSSAGTHAKPNQPMHRFALQTLSSAGIHVDHFASQPMTTTVIDGSDLILTMTDAQRSWVVGTFPEAIHKTYLLSQFAWLVGAGEILVPQAPAEWGPSLIDRAVEGRSLVQPLVDGRDIADPVGGKLRHFQNCARLIESRLEPLFSGVPIQPPN